ncbi:Nuclear pore complex protein NUP98A [Carex littledalei]|uniref:Nuclear pore complex protein NUP98A n=1 Tax=Carex littledalei TaxID=544730 RepID=A0A833VCH3_9POAL|nr:Nuclear pore complex protein NUP98A [Carex littledalei]
MFGSSRPTLFGAPASISPLFGAPNTPAPGVSSSPLFGAPNTPAHGASTSPVFGAPNTPAPGASSSPLFGENRTPVSGASSSPLFGASSTPAFGASSSPLFGASISPLFGASNKPTFSDSRSPLFNTFGTPYEVPNKPVFGASSNPFVVPTKPAFTSCACTFSASSNPEYAACGSCSNMAYNASNPAYVTSTPFPLQQSNGPVLKAFGSPFGASGTPSFGAFTSTTATGFGSSTKPAFSLRNSCECSSHLPGGFTSWSPFWKDPARQALFCFAPAKSGSQMEWSTSVAYKPLYNNEDENQHIVYMSISAVLAKNNINMSHDELKWIEYCRCNNKGAASNKSADVFQIKSTNAESDLISIKIEVPSRVATQLLDAFKSLGIN